MLFVMISLLKWLYKLFFILRRWYTKLIFVIGLVNICYSSSCYRLGIIGTRLKMQKEK